jgi:hypothetical protein
MSQGQFLLDRGAVGPNSRVRRFPALPRLIAKAAPAGAPLAVPPSLDGKTLEQAAQLIHAARTSHAP